MDLIDTISKHLRIGKREAEKKVQQAHTDGNQIIYGGQARYDCDSKPVDDDEPILLTDEVFNIPVGLQSNMLPDSNNSWDINHCINIGCNKAGDSGCCMAYRDPTLLTWHRQGDNCPTGPYQASFTRALKKKVNPLKASKRKSK